MRGRVDPQCTREISSRFVEMVELHLLLPWAELAVILGYANRTTLDAIRDGRTLPGPDKLYALARWANREGKRANIDWLFTGAGRPLLVATETLAKPEKPDLGAIDLLPDECKVALAGFVQSVRRTQAG